MHQQNMPAKYYKLLSCIFYLWRKINNKNINLTYFCHKIMASR